MAHKKKHIPSKPVTQAQKPPRKPRLLWANPWCMLDTSSGASMAVREMLIQLVKQGYEIKILGATVFDAQKGSFRLREHWETIQANRGKLININDGPLTHSLFATHSIERNKMTADEEGKWYAYYINALDTFRPDLVYFYGGQTLDLLISDEAHARGIPAASYLANGHYQATRWCRDVDLIVTDSHATANMYEQKQGFKPVPVGAFIDPGPVLASEHSRKNVLLVNPSLAKGVGIVIQLAVQLETRRPDIIFEVVESRGNWHGLVKQITTALGAPRESLKNVILTPNTDDMRPIYGRARLLLAPSLWWESFGRVAAEAMMNGIPALVSNRGGLPEVIGSGGIVIKFPDECYESPYNRLPEAKLLQPLIAAIERMYDDEDYFQQYVQRARKMGEHHRIEVSTGRLMQAFAPWISQLAGDKALNMYATRRNKQLVGQSTSKTKQALPTVDLSSQADFVRQRWQNLFALGDAKERFSKIHEQNMWNCAESISGEGSTLEKTVTIRRELPALVKRLGIKSLLDAPCGDFNWMGRIIQDMNVDYIGADIVPALVADNQEKCGGERVKFVELDITTQALPRADLMLVRDCLFHFSYEAIFKFLANFVQSKILYLLTTSHINSGLFQNRDIPIGGFRRIDLFSEPFNLPKKPIYRFDDYLAGKDHPREMLLWTRDDVIVALEVNKNATMPS